MATYISKATGNFTAAGTWSPISQVAAAELDSEAGNTAGTTSFVYSSTFTLAATNVDGVAVKINSRTASPTGTITITLANNTTPGTREGTTTLNVTDITANQGTTVGSGWYFFKFSGAVSPNGTDVYKIGFKTSVVAEVNLYRDATAGNWSRMVRLTSAASAPAALDKLMMMGEWNAGSPDTLTSFVITMDNTTTTSFGPVVSAGPPQGMVICNGATMTYGVVASTAYVLRFKGKLIVYTGGTLNIGTSGARMPSTSSGVLEFDNVAANDTNLQIQPGGVLNVYGNNISNVSALLAVDATGGATSLTTNISTGWKNGDVIAIASTTRTTGDTESKTLGADASGTSLPTIGALATSHSGTSPTQAELINLTRNVKIRGVSATFVSSITIREITTVHIEYCEFTNLGGSGGGQLAVLTTTGSFSCTFCSFHDSTVATSAPETFTTSGSGASNITFSNNVMYNNNGGVTVATNTTGTALVFDSNITMKVTGASKQGYTINTVALTFTNNTAVSCALTGMGITPSVSTALSVFTGTISGLTAHSCGGAGIGISLSYGTVSNLTSWRNNPNTFTAGIALGNFCTDMTIDTFTSFGNTNANISFISGAGGNFNTKWLNGTIGSDTTFATTNGIITNIFPSYIGEAKFYNCKFGTATGIFAAHTNDVNIGDGEYVTMTFINCTLASPTQVLGQANLTGSSYIRSQRTGQSGTTHQSWLKTGTIASEATTVNSGTLSFSMTPNNASSKLTSSSFYGAVRSGSVLYPTVFIQKSAAYNGNQPRLILKRNDSVGISADTVIATYASSTGSWNMIGGVTASASADGVMEFVVDCDGTAGVVYVDTFNIV